MCGITICFCDNSFKMLHIIYGKIKHDETVRTKSDEREIDKQTEWI